MIYVFILQITLEMTFRVINTLVEATTSKSLSTIAEESSLPLFDAVIRLLIIIILLLLIAGLSTLLYMAIRCKQRFFSSRSQPRV